MNQRSNAMSAQNRTFIRGAVFTPKKLIKKLKRIKFTLIFKWRVNYIKKINFFIICFSLLFTFLLLYHLSRKPDFIVNNYDKEIKRHLKPIGTATDNDYYVTRPNGRDDGGVVRVMFAVFSTHVDQTLCYAVASAYFTNIPIVVIGYESQTYNHIWRHSQWEKVALSAGLKDSDVILKLDSDILFTGLDYLPFVDKFIKLSPANLNELDAKAIRTGQMIPPVLYGSEGGCYSPQTIAEWHEECSGNYSIYEKLHSEYENTIDNNTKPVYNYKSNNLIHWNGGTSIQRVWAMRKLSAAFHKFMEINKPLDNKEWWCDQSVFAKLYLELRLWEIEQDYFRKHTDELRTMSNEYGLYAGLIGLDLKGEFSATVWHGKKDQDFELITDLWKSNISERLIVKSFYDKNVSSFVENLYSSSNTKELFTERMLTRSYSNVHSVTIAPPLLSVVPRHINGKDKPAERVYPWLAHYAGPEKNLRYQNALNYMQWSLPMMFDKEEWKRGKQYAMSMPIELWTSNDEKLRLRYGDVCEKHPFNNFYTMETLTSKYIANSEDVEDLML